MTYGFRAMMYNEGLERKAKRQHDIEEEHVVRLCVGDTSVLCGPFVLQASVCSSQGRAGTLCLKTG